MPKVSVLIPTYGYARFLPEAIESVLAQDFTDFELIISDDASPDGSAEIIRRYATRDPRIRCEIHGRNLGMVANWNWCLGEARGEYVKYLFGDDRLNSRHTLSRMVTMLENEPRAVLAATGRLILDKDSQATEVWDELGAPGRQDGRMVIAQCLRQDRNLVGEPSAVLFRRAAADRGFDPSWRQLVDQEMWFHLLTQGDLVYDPEPLCAFRLHPAQQTMVNRENRISSTETLLLLARYLDDFAAAVGQTIDSRAICRMIFHQIYYSRKNSRRDAIRTPELAAAEAKLLARLTRGRYVRCLILHRLLKPFFNLKRWLHPPPLGGRRPVIIVQFEKGRE
jgi:glycosyltransferase involved in cell wall biosynthesis